MPRSVGGSPVAAAAQGARGSPRDLRGCQAPNTHTSQRVIVVQKERTAIFLYNDV